MQNILWMIAAHGCLRIVVTFYVALQFNARASASLSLIDDSCPAGFETVVGIIRRRYSCQCSKIDLNIQSCDETTKAVLLKVSAVYMMWGARHPSSVLPYPAAYPSSSAQHILLTLYILFSHFLNPHVPSPYLSPCRTGCGALPSPTQTVPRSCSPQAVPVVTATASHGTQTMRQSAGSLCLRTWPRGTSSALATDKVRCEIMFFSYEQMCMHGVMEEVY